MTQVHVPMALGDWLFVDALMDNAGQRSREAFNLGRHDPVRAGQAERIRESGWNATTYITAPLTEAVQWPPDNEAMQMIVTTSLQPADWHVVVDELRRGSETASSLGDANGAGRASDLADWLFRQIG